MCLLTVTVAGARCRLSVNFSVRLLQRVADAHTTVRVAQAFSSLSVSTRDPHGRFAGPAGTSRRFCTHFDRYRMSMADIETRILQSLLLSPSTLLLAGLWLPYLLFHWLVNAYFRVGCLWRCRWKNHSPPPRCSAAPTVCRLLYRLPNRSQKR